MEVMHENKYPLGGHAHDHRFITLRSLQTPQGRSRTGFYIIEGISPAQSSTTPQLNPFFSIRQFYPIPSARSSHVGSASGASSVSAFRPDATSCLTLALEPQGIGAIVRQQWIPLAGVRAARDSFWLAVESIESPGNLGTIIRTAEAAGVSGILVLDSLSDPFDPAAVSRNQ